MFKPKPDKYTAGAKLEKHRPEKPFVQVEGKLSDEDLSLICGGVKGDDDPVSGVAFRRRRL